MSPPVKDGRFGQPKQFAVLGGRPVIEWSLDSARSVAPWRCRRSYRGIVSRNPGIGQG